ncbi:unnamed protein product [Prunus brigantina]
MRWKTPRNRHERETRRDIGGQIFVQQALLEGGASLSKEGGWRKHDEARERF